MTRITRDLLSVRIVTAEGNVGFVRLSQSRVGTDCGDVVAFAEPLNVKAAKRNAVCVSLGPSFLESLMKVETDSSSAPFVVMSVKSHFFSSSKMAQCIRKPSAHSFAKLLDTHEWSAFESCIALMWTCFLLRDVVDVLHGRHQCFALTVAARLVNLHIAVILVKLALVEVADRRSSGDRR